MFPVPAVPFPDFNVNVNDAPGSNVFELHSGGVTTVFPFSLVIVPPALQSPDNVSPFCVSIAIDG